MNKPEWGAEVAWDALESTDNPGEALGKLLHKHPELLTQAGVWLAADGKAQALFNPLMYIAGPWVKADNAFRIFERRDLLLSEPIVRVIYGWHDALSLKRRKPLKRWRVEFGHHYMIRTFPGTVNWYFAQGEMERLRTLGGDLTYWQALELADSELAQKRDSCPSTWQMVNSKESEPA